MTTTILGLPELSSSQTQKYLTINTALNYLDAMVNLTVFNRTTTTPPGSPSEGDRYIIAATATGAWTGQENNIAVYIGTNWIIFTPSEGWAAYDQGANETIIWNGTSWVSLAGVIGADYLPLAGGTMTGPFGIGIAPVSPNDITIYGGSGNSGASIQLVNGNSGTTATDGFWFGYSNAAYFWNYEATDTIFATNNSARMTIKADGKLLLTSQLGVNGATPDSGNPLVVNGDGALFNHNGGDSALKINKSASTDDASLTFQQGFTSHLLVGLLADNDTQIKVSDNGSTFYTAIGIDGSNGNVAIGKTGPSCALDVNGAIRTATYTTAGRPSASTLGVGAMIFDTTIGKPIWSNGTIWVLADGSAA